MSVSVNFINPPERILMGPGPSDVPRRVLSALNAPTIGHLDPAYRAIMDEMRTMLRQVFKTKSCRSANGPASSQPSATPRVCQPASTWLVLQGEGSAAKYSRYLSTSAS